MTKDMSERRVREGWKEVSKDEGMKDRKGELKDVRQQGNVGGEADQRGLKYRGSVEGAKEDGKEDGRKDQEREGGMVARKYGRWE